MRGPILTTSLLILAVACAPTAANGPAAASGVDRISSSYRVSGLTLDQRLSVVSAGKADQSDGKVRICAAIATLKDGVYLAEATPRYRDRLVFSLNGDIILRGADFAPTYSISEISDLGGRNASCVTTQTPWKAAFDGAKLEMKARVGNIGS